MTVCSLSTLHGIQERVNSYSITVSPPPLSGSEDFTTSNSSITLRLRKITHSTTSPSLPLTVMEYHKMIHHHVSPLVVTFCVLTSYFISMNYSHRSLPIAWSTKCFNYHTPLLLLDDTKRDSSPSCNNSRDEVMVECGINRRWNLSLDDSICGNPIEGNA